jgi:hypothetical protein
VRPIRFQHSHADGLHRFMHAPGEELVVERNNWTVLTGDWPDSDETPFMRFAVNNNNAEEMAVYLGLVWELSAGLHRYAIPAYYRDGAAKLLGQEPRFIAWEYEVDAAAEDPVERDVGFVGARAGTHIPPSAYERDHRAQAGLFAIDTFDDLVSVTLATLSDASAEVTLFALADDEGIERLLDRLRGRRRPLLEEVLRPGDRFFDLTVGVDLGYWDSLIVASKDDLSAEVESIARRFERAVEHYESRVDQTSTVGTMLDELARLAAGQA